MERGLRCPSCGTYTTLSDIIATARCRNGSRRGNCDVRLYVDVVVEE
jgi:hypothetical protein